jgi:hypothetical protein
MWITVRAGFLERSVDDPVGVGGRLDVSLDESVSDGRESRKLKRASVDGRLGDRRYNTVRGFD